MEGEIDLEDAAMRFEGGLGRARCRDFPNWNMKESLLMVTLILIGIS